MPVPKALAAHRALSLKALILTAKLPAIVISMFQSRCQALLTFFWPATQEEDEARPKFINSHALADPDTAMDLLEREIARLLRSVRGLITHTGPVKGATEHVEALGQLDESIDAFAMQLAAQAPATAHRLNLLREELAFVRYLKENTHRLCQSLIALDEHPVARTAVERLIETATHLLEEAARAATTLDLQAVDALRHDAQYRGPLVGNVQQYCWEKGASLDAPVRVALLQAVDDVRMIAAFVHHLARLLIDLVPQTTGSSVFGMARRKIVRGARGRQEEEVK
jgi:phosphate:Na+ symporter